MKTLILTLLLIVLCQADEKSTVGIIKDLKGPVDIRGSYIADYSNYSDRTKTALPTNEVRSIPVLKQGVELSFSINSKLFQLAYMVNVLSKGRYAEFGVYAITTFAPVTYNADEGTYSTWSGAYTSSLATVNGDTLTVSLLKVRNIRSFTADSLQGAYWGFDFVRSLTASSDILATNKPMYGILVGCGYSTPTTGLYYGLDASVYTGIKKTFVGESNYGGSPVNLSIVLYAAFVFGYSRAWGEGVLSFQVKESIEGGVDWVLQEAPVDEEGFYEHVGFPLWSLHNARATVSYTF